jgi:ubiquitin-protein ligase
MLSSGRRLRKELKNLESNKDDSIHLYVLDEVSQWAVSDLLL